MTSFTKTTLTALIRVMEYVLAHDPAPQPATDAKLRELTQTLNDGTAPLEAAVAANQAK